MKYVHASCLQVAVFFWAFWSQPCKQLHLVFEQLAKDNSDVRFVQVDLQMHSDCGTHEMCTAMIPSQPCGLIKLLPPLLAGGS